MSYTNQKTVWSLQVTLDYWHALVIKFTAAIRHNTSARYQCKQLSNSCKTHSKAVSLKHTIEYTNRHTRNNTIQGQNLGAFWDIPPLPPKCETSSPRPNIAVMYC